VGKPKTEKKRGGADMKLLSMCIILLLGKTDFRNGAGELISATLKYREEQPKQTPNKEERRGRIHNMTIYRVMKTAKYYLEIPNYKIVRTVVLTIVSTIFHKQNVYPDQVGSVFRYL